MSVNKAILMGNVGRDPEIKHMQSGDDLANLSIATSDSWTDKRTGERQEKTEWHRVTVFNPNLVKLVARAVKKGTQLYLEGQVQTRKWTGQDGVERHTTEVVIPRFGGVIKIVGGGKGRDETSSQPARTQGRSQADMDSEIPF